MARGCGRVRAVQVMGRPIGSDRGNRGCARCGMAVSRAGEAPPTRVGPWAGMVDRPGSSVRVGGPFPGPLGKAKTPAFRPGLALGGLGEVIPPGPRQATP